LRARATRRPAPTATGSAACVYRRSTRVRAGSAAAAHARARRRSVASPAGARHASRDSARSAAQEVESLAVRGQQQLLEYRVAGVAAQRRTRLRQRAIDDPEVLLEHTDRGGIECLAAVGEQS